MKIAVKGAGAWGTAVAKASAARATGQNAIRVRELLKRPYLLVFPSLDTFMRETG